MVYLLYVPPNGQVWLKPFFKVGLRAQWLQKYHWSREHSPKKETLRCQVINLAPLKRVRAWWDSAWSLGRAGLSACDMNISFPVPMSGGLNWLPPSQNTPDHICVLPDRAGWSASYLVDNKMCPTQRKELSDLMQCNIILHSETLSVYGHLDGPLKSVDPSNLFYCCFHFKVPDRAFLCYILSTR